MQTIQYLTKFIRAQGDCHSRILTRKFQSHRTKGACVQLLAQNRSGTLTYPHFSPNYSDRAASSLFRVCSPSRLLQKSHILRLPLFHTALHHPVPPHPFSPHILVTFSGTTRFLFSICCSPKPYSPAVHCTGYHPNSPSELFIISERERRKL
jgi:hypothetical protein